MASQPYYPRTEAAQIAWLQNYKAKIPTHGPTVGLSAELASTNYDLGDAIYILETWWPQVQNDAKEATAYKRLMLDSPATGVPNTPFPVGTTFTFPTVPNPGILKRLFNQIVRIKAHAAYTPAMGADLQIIGPEDTSDHPTPEFKLKVVDGVDHQMVNIKFTKFGHDGVYIEFRRNGGAWSYLAVDTNSPNDDNTPLLAPPAPEQREYRMRFWDAGEANGDWSAVQKVMVGV